MRTLNKNKQKMYYSLKGKREPIYELDGDGNKVIAYVDDDGNIYYKETGSYTSGWSKPVSFFANIAMSGGEAEAQEFGLSIADYNATLVMEKGKVPLTEGSVIWLNSSVLYKDEENIDVDDKSADYTVLKVSESLNFVKYVLKAIVK